MKRDLVGMRSWTVTGTDVPLEVTAVGAAEDPAVVIAHGVGSSARFVVDTFARPLVAAGLRLVSYDLRGHGRSGRVTDPADHGLDRHLGDLHAVVGAVGARLVGGVSLGGHVAVAYAARGGAVDGVVACLPAWSGRAVPGEGPHAAVAADVARRGIGALRDGFGRDPALRPWLREVLSRDWAASDADSLTAALLALDGALAPTEAELRALPVPLAVVAWPDDPGHPLAVAEDWVAWAPRGHLERTTLAAMDEDPQALGQAAVAALRRSGVAGGEDRLRGA